MTINPELRRYLWRNFTPAPVVLPLVIAGIYFYFWHVQPLLFGQTLPRQMSLFVNSLMLVLMAVVGAIFVIGSASKAQAQEVQQKTWDFQRMSNQGPLAILCGKLFGATLYGWYIIGVMLVTYVLLGALYQDFGDIKRILLGVVALFCGSIAALVVGFFISRERNGTRVESAVASVAGIFYASTIFNLLDEFGNVAQTMKWYGITIRIDNFMLLVIAFYTFWLFISGLEAMAANLRYRERNTGWLLFLLSNAVLITGSAFSGGSANSLHMLLLAATLNLIFAVVMVVLGDTSSSRYRRLVIVMRTRNYVEAFHTLPKWAVALLLSLLMWTVVFIANMLAPDTQHIVTPALLLLLGITLYACRDIVIFHVVAMDQPGFKPLVIFITIMTVYYLLVLPLLPASYNPLSMLFAIGRSGRGGDGAAALMPAVIQFAVVVALCYKPILRKLRPPQAETKIANT